MEKSLNEMYEELKRDTEFLTEAFRIKDTVYFRYKDRVMPCVRVDDTTYLIKTVLYWSMVEKKLEWLNRSKQPVFSKAPHNKCIAQ